MSARSDLADLIAGQAGTPDTWEIFAYPTRLRTFDDPAKPVAIVIEQRSLTASRFAAGTDGIPVEVALTVWVVVDGARGDGMDVIEDDLETALEQLLLILEGAGLPDHVWDGSAQRDQYDDQKPAYQIQISAAGALTEPEITP